MKTIQIHNGFFVVSRLVIVISTLWNSVISQCEVQKMRNGFHSVSRVFNLIITLWNYVISQSGFAGLTTTGNIEKPILGNELIPGMITVVLPLMEVCQYLWWKKSYSHAKYIMDFH